MSKVPSQLLKICTRLLLVLNEFGEIFTLKHWLRSRCFRGWQRPEGTSSTSGINNFIQMLDGAGRLSFCLSQCGDARFSLLFWKQRPGSKLLQLQAHCGQTSQFLELWEVRFYCLILPSPWNYFAVMQIDEATFYARLSAFLTILGNLKWTLSTLKLGINTAVHSSVTSLIKSLVYDISWY